MYQFDLSFGTNSTHDINYAKADARARMHSQTCGLIYHHQVLIFEQHCFFDTFNQPGCNISFRVVLWFNAHRRHPDQVADHQFIFGLAAFFINPHLSLADDPVYPSFGYVLQRLQQEVIQSLIDLGGADFDKAYSRFLRGIRIQMMAARIKCVIFWCVALYCLNRGQYTTKKVFNRKQFNHTTCFLIRLVLEIAYHSGLPQDNIY